jgi:hypothetical protein
MSKNTPIRDTNSEELKAPEPPKQVELTLANAPIFSAKFLEMIVVELRRLNMNLESKNG